MPFITGETKKGWGVVRESPWNFEGLYPSKDVAETKAAELGRDYIAKFGENRVGTDEFIWSSAENP